MEGHGILYSIIIGFFAGLIARALYPGDQKAGFIMTTLLGIAGSWVANTAGEALGFYQGEVAGLIGSVVGAFFVLAIYLIILKQRKN
jgi:uncharacterized membrane protein YeaQ/YmgE (transglycosylase-associated protein family)